MKNKLITMLAIIFLFAIYTSEAKKFKKYPHKSGHIEYKITGSTTGTQSLYWDDYGMKEVTFEDSKTKVLFTKTELKQTMLTLGKYAYSWKEEDDFYSRAINPVAEIWEKEGYDDKDMERVGKDLLEKMGFEYVGKEKMNGKNCEKWESQMLGTSWMWEGVAVKTQVSILGIKVVIDAVKINIGANVPASKFALPKDKEMRDMDLIMDESGEEGEDAKEMQKNAKEMLKGLFGK